MPWVADEAARLAHERGVHLRTDVEFGIYDVTERSRSRAAQLCVASWTLRHSMTNTS